MLLKVWCLAEQFSWSHLSETVLRVIDSKLELFLNEELFLYLGFEEIKSIFQRPTLCLRYHFWFMNKIAHFSRVKKCLWRNLFILQIWKSDLRCPCRLGRSKNIARRSRKSVSCTSTLSALKRRSSKGSSINDVTKLYTFFDTPQSCCIVLRLQPCRHIIIDPSPLRPRLHQWTNPNLKDNRSTF